MINVLKHFIGKKIELTKLELLDRMSEKAGQVVFYAIVAFFSILCLITFTFFLSFWLGSLLGEIYYGFLSVFGIYLIILIILLSSKKYFINKIQDKVIESASEPKSSL